MDFRDEFDRLHRHGGGNGALGEIGRVVLGSPVAAIGIAVVVDRWFAQFFHGSAPKADQLPHHPVLLSALWGVTQAVPAYKS
jgi:hypothetical protein